MDIVIKYIFEFTLLIAETAAYAFLLGVFLPKTVLRLRYYTDRTADRGLHKYIYETGRAVTYEPHPAERKFIRMYSLFCHNGYKYILCRPDEALRRISYRVTTFNRKNKVIDTVTVNEQITTPGTCAPVMLHHETAYACVQVLSVNEEKDVRRPLIYVRRWNAWIYTIVSVLITFAATLLFSLHARRIYELIAAVEPPVQLRLPELLLLSVVIGVLYAYAVLRAAQRKV